MVLLFLHFLALQFHLKVPAVFFYSSTRMVLAALTTLLLTIFLGPFVIRRLYAIRTGQSIRVDDCPMLAELHKKKKDTPTMGGILILGSLLISALLWMDLHTPFTYILCATLVWMGGIGIIDDFLKMKHKNSKGLRARIKFGWQLLFAILLSLYLFPPSTGAEVSYFLPFIKGPLFTLSGWALFGAFGITLLVITGSSNAVNLTDGLDGLASGCVMLVALVFALFAFLSNHVNLADYLNIPYIEGSGEIAVFLTALFGACLGFLWYNGHPAQVFMGDTGSIALGGLLGVVAVLIRREFLLALVGGIFVLEALSVILQVLSYRYAGKRRIFRCAPLHHHFEYMGWPETKVVVRFWIIGIVLALVGVASIKFQ